MRDAADWSAPGFPCGARLLLAGGALMIVVACHLSVLTRCFARVTVADPFDGAPIWGDPLNVVHGVQGWVARPSSP